jgi:tetratricopeptide (TPR) repeat protein
MDRNLPAKKWTAFLLLLFIIFLIYSNTFQAAWHFDDYPNILNNPRIRINDLKTESIVQTFFASRDGGLYLGKKLYRPISCLTLALNWYVGKENAKGYHVVNLIIHFLTAFILFNTILVLFKTSNLSGRYEDSKYFIALLTAIFWAANPIQSQAVTYIVQRMASLTAMFYILSIYLYLKARLSKSTRSRIFLFTGCFLGFLFALGSKENAATLPIALILLEIVFFQNLKKLKRSKALVWGVVIIGFLTALLGIYLIYQGKFSSLIAGYNARSFTSMQRLMTQPRIMLFYISQIFYPLPSRLSIEHDIAISTSLFNPWTTLPSIILIFALIGLGISQIHKRPILSFAILFFFLNHLIESTIIPLELIFEHRNYLPSLFVFFPISAGIVWLLNHYRQKKPFMYAIIICALPILIAGLSLGTYLRNMVWSNEKTLWEDAIKKAPGRARPYQNLAWGYYEKIGNLKTAFNLYEKALELKGSQPKYSQISSLGNMAEIYYKQGEYERAVDLCKKALDIYPHYMPVIHIMVLSSANLGNWEEAFESARLLLSKNYLKKEYRTLYGFSLLKLKKYKKALEHFRDTLRMYPNDVKIIYNIGVTLSLMQYYDRADLFLRWAKQISPDNILILFYLIENKLKAGDDSGVDRYLEQLFATRSIEKILSAAHGTSEDKLLVTYSPELLAPLIARKMEEKTLGIETLNIPLMHHSL